MTSIEEDDMHNKIIAEILKICIDGRHRTKYYGANTFIPRSVRRIMAEIVDRELLHYIEARRVYITTDHGYIFLKKA